MTKLHMSFERLSFSEKQVNTAQAEDQNLCSRNELNFLKLLYFLWQDQSRKPHLASVTVYPLNQPSVEILALSKKAQLKTEYGLANNPETHLGTPAYLSLQSSEEHQLGIRSLFQTSADVALAPSVFVIDVTGRLLHRPLNLEPGAPFEKYLHDGSSNAKLLKKIKHDLNVDTVVAAYRELGQKLQTSLLGLSLTPTSPSGPLLPTHWR